MLVLITFCSPSNFWWGRCHFWWQASPSQGRASPGRVLRFDTWGGCACGEKGEEGPVDLSDTKKQNVSASNSALLRQTKKLASWKIPSLNPIRICLGLIIKQNVWYWVQEAPATGDFTSLALLGLLQGLPWKIATELKVKRGKPALWTQKKACSICNSSAPWCSAMFCLDQALGKLCQIRSKLLPKSKARATWTHKVYSSEVSTYFSVNLFT